MRTLISFMLLLVSMHCVAVTASQVRPYDGRIEFDVIRNGETVGEHIVSFSHQGPQLRVDIRMTLDFRAFLLFRYRFSYQATEWWRDDILQRLEVELDERGKLKRISGRRQGERLQLRGDLGRASLSLPLLTTNHWNPAALQQQRLLNTLTGELSRIEVQFERQETVQVADQQITGWRYHYGGDLADTRVWYDKQKRWVGLSFIAQDGSEIRFVCRQIGQPREKAAGRIRPQLSKLRQRPGSEQ